LAAAHVEGRGEGDFQALLVWSQVRVPRTVSDFPLYPDAPSVANPRHRDNTLDGPPSDLVEVTESFGEFGFFQPLDVADGLVRPFWGEREMQPPNTRSGVAALGVGVAAFAAAKNSATDRFVDS